MTMKPFLVLLTLGVSSLLADPGISNPVQDYAQFHRTVGAVIYQWTVDINDDGKLDVLLDTKLTNEEIAMENRETKNRYDSNVHAFQVYIGIPSGSGYIKSEGVADEEGVGPSLPEIDITQCYVGQIAELNAYGIVTVKLEAPREGAAVARIYGYTVESDHLRETKLAEYRADDTNAVYDKYLAPSKRTMVQLQLVGP